MSLRTTLPCLALVVLLVLSHTSHGQTLPPPATRPAAPTPPNNTPEDRTARPDSLRTPFFSYVTVWADYVKPLTQFINGQEQYAFGGNIAFWQAFQLSGSYGTANLTFNEPSAYINGSYSTQGTYWRAGIDALLGPQKNIWVGVRYAQSAFTDQVTGNLSSVLFPDYTLQYTRSQNVQWWELVLGTEGSLFSDKYPKALQNIRFGWMARLRAFHNLTQPADTPPIYFIPGYGRAANTFNGHINLTLGYRLGQ